MNNYNNYPQYTSDQYHNHAPIPQHMVYPHKGAMPIMSNPMHSNPHMSPRQPYPTMSPQSNNGNYSNNQQPITQASHIISEPTCRIYRTTTDSTEEATEFTARQLIAFDGKIFIEHLPGHNIIYAPSKPRMPSHITKLKLKAKTMDRPKNVFFMYRSHKVKEMQQQYPKLNQTVFSRIVAEHWKNESDEVKVFFRQKYNDEMKQYELAKKVKTVKKHRFDLYSQQQQYLHMEEDGGAQSDGTAVASGDARIKYSRESSVERIRGPPMPFARQRSFTMPADPRQQADMSRIIY
ncbi:hypothetical protein LPJ66_010200 [Kickxella alabastrina]|uniref:Uncharacterized protein n=1 Tax=Kickxella alabastrina TaxID=61397 RepID=A0ACC1I156_9FUNG|nr:hypothetical protein LPJ66_010200 [Kickxella alabastrina]